MLGHFTGSRPTGLRPTEVARETQSTMIRLVTVTLFAALTGASPLLAQQHQHRGGPGGAGMQQQGDMMPGMQMRAFAPELLIEKKADLELTAQQLTALQKLAADAKAKHDEAMASHEEHRQALMEALGAPVPNPELVRAHFQGAHDSMGAAHWAEMQGALAAMAVLTDAQRATVKSWPAPTRMMGEGMQRGMNRNKN
jgi:Spy/CpxP family protein refolding chaperone